MDNTDKWTDRVQKLLNMAQDPNLTPEAAQTYTEKAEEIMVKHAIDSAMLQAASKGQNGLVDEIIVRTYDIDNPYTSSKVTLFGTISNNFSCKAVQTKRWDYSTTPKTRVTTVTLVGYSQDVEKVEMLYYSLLIQLFNAMATTVVPAREHGKTFRTALALGFVSAVYQRLTNLTNQAKVASGPGTDIVLRNRTEDVNRVVNGLFSRLTKTKTMSARPSSGYARGHESGMRADIGQSRVGGNRPAIR